MGRMSRCDCCRFCWVRAAGVDAHVTVLLRPYLRPARYYISTHPEVDAKIRAELAEHGLLATRDSLEPREPNFDDLARLPYLAAAIKESMRMKPVGADAPSRSYPHDVVLNGHTIPANTIICECGT